MKYPKALIVKLKNDKEFKIEFQRVIYLPTKDIFQVSYYISRKFIDGVNEDLGKFITEERD